jgi:hypothetical protein
MTITAATHPFTVSGFLFGEDQDTEQALAQALHEHGVLGPMSTTLELVSQAGREAAGNQVAVVADGLLDLDLGDLVVAGWRKQGQLAAAAERTAANPGSSEVVELATHRISSAHHPSVELLVNDVHVATVTFDLEVEFVVKALVVTVRDGHVVSLHAGPATWPPPWRPRASGWPAAGRTSSCRWSSAGRCCYASAAAPTPCPTGPSPPRHRHRCRPGAADRRSATPCIGSAVGADRARRQTKCRRGSADKLDSSTHWTAGGACLGG